MQRPSDSGDLESILYELERKQVDCCIYYVALDSLGINATSEDTNDEGWSLPTESKPGEWRVVENPEINLLSDYGVSRPRLLKLHTLSGLILFSRLKRKLFLAEFAGSSIEIQSNVIPISGDKSVPFSRNVRKGVMVAKARLIREESNWNDYTAYRFACDCAERAISRNTLVHNHVDSIYLEGIKFVRASVYVFTIFRTKAGNI
jgi:hypothetical protein